MFLFKYLYINFFIGEQKQGIFLASLFWIY